MKKAILIVDPLISPNYLCERLKDNGYSMVVLRTIKNVCDYFDYSNINAEIIESTNDVQKDISLLNNVPYRIISGIYGSEVSVEYADRLFKLMFLDNFNAPETSNLRFDKYDMMERIKNTPYYINQLKIDGNNKAENDTNISFMSEHKNMLIKPSSGSAASFGVKDIYSMSDLKQYLGVDNFLIKSSNEFVLQEKINIKTEYYIDAVSYKGNMVVSSIGKYCKQGVKYKFIDIVTDQAESAPLEGITKELMRVLGCKNGLYHFEIALTDQLEFKLIELNARCSGLCGYINKMAKNYYGYDQIDTYISMLEHQDIQVKNIDISQRICVLDKENINFKRLMSDHDHLALTGQSDQDDLTSSKGLLLLKSTANDSILHDSNIIFGCG